MNRETNKKLNIDKTNYYLPVKENNTSYEQRNQKNKSVKNVMKRPKVLNTLYQTNGTLNSKLNLNDIKNLQEYYYRINSNENLITSNNQKNNKNLNEKENYIKCGFFDYAINKTIFNHPQIYVLNTNKKKQVTLPKLENRFYYRKVRGFEKLVPDSFYNNELESKREVYEFCKRNQINKKPRFKTS